MAHQKISQGAAEEKFTTLGCVGGPTVNPVDLQAFPHHGERIRAKAAHEGQGGPA